MADPAHFTETHDREFGRWLYRATENLVIEETPRLLETVTSLSLAMDHHAAIAILLQHGLTASAAALLGVQFETMVRGMWLAHVANDTAFERNCEVKAHDLHALIGAITTKCRKTGELLDKLHRASGVMSRDYAHAQAEAVEVWLRDIAIEQKVDSQAQRAVRESAEVMAVIAGLQLAKCAGRDDVCRVLAKRIGVEL